MHKPASMFTGRTGLSAAAVPSWLGGGTRNDQSSCIAQSRHRPGAQANEEATDREPQRAKRVCGSTLRHDSLVSAVLGQRRQHANDLARHDISALAETPVLLSRFFKPHPKRLLTDKRTFCLPVLGKLPVRAAALGPKMCLTRRRFSCASALRPRAVFERLNAPQATWCGASAPLRRGSNSGTHTSD